MMPPEVGLEKWSDGCSIPHSTLSLDVEAPPYFTLYLECWNSFVLHYTPYFGFHCDPLCFLGVEAFLSSTLLLVWAPSCSTLPPRHWSSSVLFTRSPCLDSFTRCLASCLGSSTLCTVLRLLCTPLRSLLRLLHAPLYPLHDLLRCTISLCAPLHLLVGLLHAMHHPLLRLLCAPLCSRALRPHAPLHPP